MPEGVPYYRPEKPVIAENNGLDVAKIIGSFDLSGSYTRGLAAMGQLATARQRAQLESEQMATDAALKSRQLDIARENNLLDFKASIKSSDALQDYRRDEIQIQQQNADSIDNYRKEMLKIRADPSNPLSLAGRAKARILKEQDFATFANEAAPLIDDPNPKNPVDYYEKVQRLHDTWQFSNDTRVKDALKQLKLRTEDHGISLKDVGYDENDNPILVGKAKKRPVGQIVENLRDPDHAETMMAQLEANNLIVKQPPHETGIDVTGTKERSWLTEWLLGKPTQKQTVTETTLAPSISRYANMAAGVDFSRGKPRTPAASVAATDTSTLPASRDGQQEVTTRDVGDATARMQEEQSPDLKNDPLFPETETDKTLRNAADFVSENPGRVNIDGLKAKLQSMGIDPTRLDEELAKRRR